MSVSEPRGFDAEIMENHSLSAIRSLTPSINILKCNSLSL